MFVTPKRCNRFIPALAGNIYLADASWTAYTVHPRACGEHPGLLDDVAFYSGSSPRLRGTYITHRIRIRNERFIPALAGNMDDSSSLSTIAAVHPRACGEHCVGKRQSVKFTGSSPRLRGTSCQLYFVVDQLRFIPALAGNIFICYLPLTDYAVHPRACGEHCYRTEFFLYTDGSSPRLRGTSKHSLSCSCYNRFIPALAGNIVTGDLDVAAGTVHPRACGEHR